MPDFLLEIGTEEIPAPYLPAALNELEQLLLALLEEERLSFEELGTMGTPRRLVATITDLPVAQTDTRVEVAGPPARVAFPDGDTPSRAAEGFARKQGVSVDSLEIRETPRGKYVYAHKQIEGRTTQAVLEGALPELIGQLSWPKSMRWEPTGFLFARPLRSLVGLLGNRTLGFELAGVKSGSVTFGHPFLQPDAIELKTADASHYRSELKNAWVIVDRRERRSLIRRQLLEIYERNEVPFRYDALLEEVVDLVEWPHTLVGSFAEEFLGLPRAVIEAAMMDHQRYFPFVTGEGRVLPRFAVVSNRLEKHADTVRQGNERVLAARLSDAFHFFRQDLKVPLGDRRQELEKVVYLEGLGSYLDRSRRLEALAGRLSTILGLEQEAADALGRAAALCKADLLTEMVGEFPKLQGIVGGEYARHEGQPEVVAQAIAEHYQPRGHRDDLPESRAGALLAVVDKLDHLACCFAVGLRPKGNQDPYALRRAAAGVIRILLHHRLALDLEEAVAAAVAGVPDGDYDGAEVTGAVMEFFEGRLKVMALDQGIRHDLVDAVLDVGFSQLGRFEDRLVALQDLSQDACWTQLVELVERTAKITAGFGESPAVDPELLQEAAEKSLQETVAEHGPAVTELVDAGQFVEAGRLLCDRFAGQVHRFFDEVYVNAEDPALKRNRLSLVQSVYDLFGARVANLSKVVSDGG